MGELLSGGDILPNILPKLEIIETGRQGKDTPDYNRGTGSQSRVEEGRDCHYQ